VRCSQAKPKGYPLVDVDAIRYQLISRPSRSTQIIELFVATRPGVRRHTMPA
jgi:hypothetical protein